MTTDEQEAARLQALVPGEWHNREGMRSMARVLQSRFGKVTAAESFIPGLVQELDALTDDLRQALHDRDRFHRDAEYWREECIKLTGEALA